MKTPEEIKRGLEYCPKYEDCTMEGCECPYFMSIMCSSDLMHDALEYINELEARTSLNTLRDAIYEDAVAHGLWESTDNTVQSIIEYYQELERDNLLCVPYYQDKVMRVQAAKIIGEEQAELELSSDDEEAYVDELADVIIASLSVAVKLGIDIDAAVRRKMEINKGRPWKHGKEGK